MSLGKGLMFCVLPLSLFYTAGGTCSFPSTLAGVFDESEKGVLTFTSNQLMSYSIHNFGVFSFDCVNQYSSTKYILKSTTQISYFSLLWDAYLCWDITQISSDKFYFYDAAAPLSDAGGENVKMYFANVPPNYAEICSVTSFSAGTYRFLMRNDTVSTSKIACPSELEYFWTYTIDTGSGDTCSVNDTRFGVCADTTALTFNYTLCPSYLAYSGVGSVNCLYSMNDSMLTYLTTYNSESNIDNSNTYRYTCLILDMNDSQTIYATQYPKSCQASQNATYTSSPGASLVLSYNTTCVEPTTVATTTVVSTTVSATSTTTTPTVSAASLDWVAGVVVGVLIFIALLIGCYIYCLYNYKKDLNERERKVIDKRAADDDFRATSENVEERGQAPPSVKFKFPDYTLRFLQKTWNRHGDRAKLVRDEVDRPLSPSGIAVRDAESPDSALGLDEEDGYSALRSQRTRPVSDFMKRLIALHDENREKEKEKAKVPEEKRFIKVHGRQGFKSESSLKNAGHMNLVSKIKKMARKRRKTSAVYQTEAPEVGKINEIEENEANEARDEVRSEASDTSIPAQLDVSQMLAYTAIPPTATTELPRGDERKPKAVTIAESRSYNNDVVVEDLEEMTSRTYPRDSPDAPQTSRSGRAVDQSKIYTIGDVEVTPNLKIRREPTVPKVRNESFLSRIHRKRPVAQGLPDIETARMTSGRLRRTDPDNDWGKYLDEVYPDKLYLDYAKETSLKSEGHLRRRADDGLDYLYDRAMYWKGSDPMKRPASRAKSTRSIRKKVHSAHSTGSVSRSRSLKENQSQRDTEL